MKEHVWRCRIQCEDGYTYARYVRAPSGEEARKRVEGQLNEVQRDRGQQVLPDVDDMGTVILGFAQFDCKNQVSICLDYPERPYGGRNTDEERILLDMQLEYLLRVLNAQEQVKSIFLPRLEAADDRVDPESDVEQVFDEHHETHRTEWDKVQRLYYT